ncbi:MAG: hypothetical protein QCI38_01650 [Candidatus Thermoplasmatota archaeon]|nr:hypothetical protein [Candidatus Thermoplasmatota archaeon]
MSYDQYGQQPPPHGGWEQPPPQQPPQQYPPQQPPPQGYQQPPPQGYGQYPPQQPPPGYGMGPPAAAAGSSKMLIAIIAVVAVVAVVAVYFVFMAGGASPVGTWTGSGQNITFNADGSGSWDGMPFTWANGKISLMGQEIASYSVSGETLSISFIGAYAEEGTLTLTKSGSSTTTNTSPLGHWESDSGEQLMLAQDGTGYIQDTGGNYMALEWSGTAVTLDPDSYSGGPWSGSFTVSGNTLTLSVPSLSFTETYNKVA